MALPDWFSRLGWFIGLWVAGVVAIVILAYVIRLMLLG